MVAVNGEMDGLNIDLGGRVYRTSAPWICGIAEKESVADDFQFSNMRYYFLTWKFLEESLACGCSRVGDRSRSGQF